MGTDGETEPERARTDEGLRIERRTTDEALAERRAAIEDADLVIEHARENADAALDAARGEADDKLEQASTRSQTRATVAEERVALDDAVRDERSAADESLQRERDETRQALSKLLPLERGKTDRFLLTERARADAALSKRDDFLGIVSHDLRNLLGGIVVGAGQLARLSPANEAATSRIERYAARMNRLVGDLLDVSSIDAGKFSVTPISTDARPLIAEAVDTFLHAASAGGLALRVNLPDEPLVARIDHDRMLQVLANLLTNAIKFTSAGGAIDVSGERVPGGIRVTVADTGIGIPPGMLDAIFERFWQSGKSDRRGVGLGLYISRCIVDAHGGEIRAESTPGEGSRFVLTVPS